MLLLLILPWLNPYAAGPTRNLWPWLISAACAVGVFVLRRHLSVRRVATAWLVAALASAALGLVQYAGLAHLGDPFLAQIGAGEAFGNLRQRNQFASLMSIGLVSLVALLSLRDPSAQRPSEIPAWAYAAAVLLAFGNAASSSRTGLLGWLLGLALFAWWHWPEGKARVSLLVKAVLIYGLAALLLPWWLQTWQSAHQDLAGAAAQVPIPDVFGRMAEARNDSRRELWANVLYLIAQKPWLGWGWGELDYAHFITLYPGARFPDKLDNAHNLPLQLAAELGVPAALLICAALVWVVWRGQPWRETDPARQAAWGVLAMIALHSLLEYPLWYGPFQMAAGLCGAYLWLCRSPASAAAWRAPRRPDWRVGAAAVGLLAALAYVGQDYWRVSQIYLPPDQRHPAFTQDPLSKTRDSWLFERQVHFAELSTTVATPANAAVLFDMAQGLLHYSPEPGVVEKLIDSAHLLSRADALAFYVQRYQAAYPAEYAAWVQSPAGLRAGAYD